jgi:hypothetical protein
LKIYVSAKESIMSSRTQYNKYLLFRCTDQQRDSNGKWRFNKYKALGDNRIEHPIYLESDVTEQEILSFLIDTIRLKDSSIKSRSNDIQADMDSQYNITISERSTDKPLYILYRIGMVS